MYYFPIYYSTTSFINVFVGMLNGRRHGCLNCLTEGHMVEKERGSPSGSTAAREAGGKKPGQVNP